MPVARGTGVYLAFAGWFAALPHRYKIMIAGNHDFAFETCAAAAEALVPAGVTYLRDAATIIEMGVDSQRCRGTDDPWASARRSRYRGGGASGARGVRGPFGSAGFATRAAAARVWAHTRSVRVDGAAGTKVRERVQLRCGLSAGECADCGRPLTRGRGGRIEVGDRRWSNGRGGAMSDGRSAVPQFPSLFAVTRFAGLGPTRYLERVLTQASRSTHT